MNIYIIQNSKGYSLLLVTILLALASLLVSGAMSQIATSSRTIESTQVRSNDYFDAEATIGRTLSWMRANSQSFVWPFRRDNFYTYFSKTSATVGDNDTSEFTIPTKIKLIGGNNSAILTTSSYLATGEFAATKNITTNANYDSQDEFLAADLGNAEVRITLIDAIAEDETKDFGPLPADTPKTDFTPIYRIDAMVDVNLGSHVHATVVGNIIHLFDFGVYGEEYLEIRQPCDSYESDVGAYNSAGNRNANCTVGSNSTAAIHKNEEVYGNIKTNGEIAPDPPYGGEACADFSPGCPNKGETCAGEDCGVPLLEQFQDWSTYCTSDQGNLTINSDTTLTQASGNCWNTVKVNNGVVLALSDTSSPFFIKTLDLANNSTLSVIPDDPNETVQLYVNKIAGDKFNGNQIVNGTSNPTNFYMIYLGGDDLTLNGNANMNVAIVAPNAGLTISGNFDFFGAALAKRMYLTGSGGVHYDESLNGAGPVSDVQYRARDIVQYYR